MMMMMEKAPLFLFLLFFAGAFCGNIEQFTPNQAQYNSLNQKPLDAGNSGHDPDGVFWISQETWENAEWDGVPFNPSEMTREEFKDAICPSGDVIRGIREVFYENNPFADNSAPTKAEIDEWHRIAINHLRALVGYTQPERQVEKDHCMFARSLWGQQRRFTTQWDAAYPGTVDSAYGPCGGGTNAHCGATFVPNATDQVAYLPAGHDACTTGAGSEGISGAPKSNIPWSIRWSRAVCGFIGSEGFWGGHTGPFFHREKFGFSFWDNDVNENNNNAVLRGKWTGNLMENLYCNPETDEDCDTSNGGADGGARPMSIIMMG